MTPRFFVDQPLDVALSANSAILLPETATHHALRVLRLATGDSLVLFNGDGRSYSAQIDVNGKKATATVVKASSGDPVSRVKLRLIQCLSSAEKMDWTLEKATELGADDIVIVQSERSKVRLDADRIDKKLERWQDLVIAACGQCGRNTVPKLDFATSLEKSLESSGSAEHEETLVFTIGNYPSLVKQLREIRADCRSVRLVVGPESGFSENELASALSFGARPTSLGWRILRTETAGPAVLAITESWLSDRAANLG
jgi:16S rRNA (uracil1498-N3)-methyltransferase